MLTLLVGYPMAYWMARCLTTGKSLALILVIIPFLTSFLIRTYAWFIILDPQGYLVRAVHDLGFERLAAAATRRRRSASGSSTATCRC